MADDLVRNVTADPAPIMPLAEGLSKPNRDERIFEDDRGQRQERFSGAHVCRGRRYAQGRDRVVRVDRAPIAGT